jgi:hypothetical protein
MVILAAEIYAPRNHPIKKFLLSKINNSFCCSLNESKVHKKLNKHKESRIKCKLIYWLYL